MYPVSLQENSENVFRLYQHGIFVFGWQKLNLEIIWWHFYSALTRGITALNIITPAYQTHKSFLKPSQLPGEYTAQLLPFQTQQPTLPSQVPIYSWVERSNYGKVSCSRTSRSRSGVWTHILTTQPSEHKSNALNRSAMALQILWNIQL